MEAMGFLPPSLTPVMRAEVAELPAQEAPPSGLTIAEVADDVAYAHLLAVQRETLGETYTLRAQLKRMLDAWLPGRYGICWAKWDPIGRGWRLLPSRWRGVT